MPEKFGAYLVYELLGQGGMATVHRAESQSIGGFRKRVALKRLLPHLLEEPEVVESFAREAKLASHLRHANIAQTYDLGIADGAYFIAMELVAGPTLRQLVRQAETAAGAIPIQITLDVVIQVCGALEYAHALCDEHGTPLGIVHRDVSPANIILASSGAVKLIDFGLAKVSSGRNTQTGILKGKLGYMAPEYTLGQLDARADLFAIGVILHELLTGRRLFDHDNDFEIVNMLREMPIQPPSRWNPDVGRDLDDVVMTALDRDPRRRWQSASALRAALTNIVREQNISITPTELAKWTEWAFSQQPRMEESGLARIIGSLGDPSEPSVRKAPERAASAMELDTVDLMMTPTPTPMPMPTPTPESYPDAVIEREITDVATAPRAKPPGRPMTVRKRSDEPTTTSVLPVMRQRRWLPIVMVALVIAGAIAAAVYIALS